MPASRFEEPEVVPISKEIPPDRKLPEPYVGEEIFSIPEPEWLLPGFIQEGGLTVLAAEPGNGKSLIMQDWANVLAADGSGWKWMGRERARKSKVGYIMAEGQGGLPGRVLAWQASRRVTETPRVAYFMRRFSLWHRPGEELDQIQAELLQWVKDNELDVLFVDTLAATFGGGNENMQQDMNQYMDVLQKIQDEGCSVVIAHHLAKNGSIRGSTVLTGDADTIVALEAKFVDGFLQWVWVHCYKQKDGPAFKPMLLVPVEYDVPLRHKTSVVLEYQADEKPKAGEGGQTDYESKLFAAIMANPGKSFTHYRGVVQGTAKKLGDAREALLSRASIEERERKLYPV